MSIVDQDYKEVKVIFSNKTYATLSLLAARKNIIKTDALRRAISLTNYIEMAIEGGAKILIERNGILNELKIEGLSKH